MKNLKEKLLADLKAIKESGITYRFEDDYRDIINLVIDYMNETQDFSLDKYTYRFTDEYMLWEYIRHRLKEFWALTVARDLKDIDEDTEYYIIDDTFWNVRNATEDDVKELLDEIIEELEND